MPSGPRIRHNNVYGTITDNPLGIGATSFNSAGLVNLPIVASAHAVVTLDPLRQFGEPEIVIVTAHTAAAPVATITRGAYGTTPRAHPESTVWVHAPIDEDVTEILTSSTRPSNPYRGQDIFETDTNRYVSRSTADVWQQKGLFFDPPACRVFRTVNQSIPNTTWTAIIFDNEEYDTDNLHSNTVNPTRITITTPGLYLLTSTIIFSPAIGNRLTGFRKNNLHPTDPTEGFVAGTGNASNEVGFTLTQVVKAIVGDYWEVLVWQGSGGAINASVVDGGLTFTATWIGRGN